jgi:hypothetical protein
MDRAEKLKLHIEAEKATGKYREQLQLEENSTGHSYHSVFSRFLEPTVREVHVEDPYIRSPHQVKNIRLKKLMKTYSHSHSDASCILIGYVKVNGNP